jgi:hydrogenase 3 maturation protease
VEVDVLDLDGLPEGRVIVVGVGSTVRSDDGAGPAVAGLLAADFPDDVIDAGQAPENYVAPVRRAEPAAVILVDAADFGGAPGEVRTARASDVEGLMMDTHAAPLSMFMHILNDETGADVRLVAIQAGSMEFGERLGPEVAAAVEEVARGLGAVLREAARR